MAVQYLYQIVFCSERTGRATRREIAISERSAMVTQVEALPPGYEFAIANMRRENEEIFRVAGNIKFPADFKGCTFCGNMGVFHCPCGALSCSSMEKIGRHHCCPQCGVLYDTVRSYETKGSASGLTDGQGRRPLPASPAGRFPDTHPVFDDLSPEMQEEVRRQENAARGARKPVDDDSWERGGSDWDFLKIEDGARQLPGPEPQRRLPAPSGGRAKLLDWLEKKKKDGDR